MEEGQGLDFGTFPFQRSIYADFGDRSLATVDVMKSGQCGISAAAVSLALYAGDQWQANVLYVLPGAADAFDFSDSRVATAIEGSPYLAARFGGTSNKGLKRIGHGWLYFRGSVSEKKALSIPADVLILDEYDRLDQRNIPAFRKRLGSPKSLKLERRFSNPSWPEAGIHRLWLDSDQHEWLVRCTPCRHEAPVHYEATDGEHQVDEERALRICGRCRRPLSREVIAGGRWVAARPAIARRGYHVSKLISPDQVIAELTEEHRSSDETALQAHYNFDLGLPYSPRGGSLSEATVDACRRRYVPPDAYTGPDWVTAGVDVGRVLHVRISRWMTSGRAAPLFIGEIPGFRELAQLWDRYGVNFGLIDERPEERQAREFAAAFGGRVMLIRWAGREQRDELVVDADHGLVIARRTWACDQTIASYEAQQRLLPENLPRHYVPQVTAVYRTFEETMSGQKVAIYVRQRPDDYFFAETYDLMARLARGGPAAEGAGPAPESIRARSARARS
ncbi:MAG: terminase gpA endonuclease subunit [Actinomycetota bacterium]